MSTPKESESPLIQALAGVPGKFRNRLVKAYLELKRNHFEGRHEAAGLSAGKFCEVALRHLQKAVLGAETPFGRKIPNFADECRKLITSPTGAAVESLRVIIPRALVFIYTMRNKRGIGHVGGDVEANAIDSATLARVADWVIAELIRVHHGLSLEEAQGLVDGLAVREMPQVWEVGGKKRILRPGLVSKEQTLLLLYSNPDTHALVEDLFEWVEYSTLAMYKRKVLRPLHTGRLIEFDEEEGIVYLSPLGATEVEDRLLG